MHDDDLVDNADSVNYLITQLCRNLASQQGLEEPELSTAVRKLKSDSFEILLKKSVRPHTYPPSDDKTEFDPQRAVDMHIFAAKLHSRADPQVCARYAALEQQMKSISDVPYFSEGPGRGVLHLLLLLQGNLHEEEQVPVPSPPALLIPGPFTLFASYENNRYYPKPQTCDWLNPQPRFFKGVQDIKASDNPYMPKYLLGGECNLLAKIEQKYGAKPTRPPATAQDCTFTAMTRRVLGSSMRVHMTSFRLLSDSEQQPLPAKELLTKLKLKCGTNSVPVVEKQVAFKEEPRILSWNWQSLGCRGVLRQRPFASEVEVVIDLKCHLLQMRNAKFETNIMTRADFLHDLKALAAGIQSETFQHDDRMVFSMLPNITVKGLLPDTVSSYAASFLECGTCYKRLHIMIQKRDYKLMFEGFIFRALCSAIAEYLLTFRQYVFAQQDDTLIGFYARMRKMMRQISNLSFTLAIHTDVEAHVSLPMGSQFLGYLYREIVHTTEKDYIMLLVYILKSCCHVYFKHLQKWIYYGLLDDPSNELFICFVDHYRSNTKYFYDKAYFVRKESVPGFFQGYEDDILQCGKYTMLLKAYKPSHPLFRLDYPLISVCLTYEEIQSLKKKCIKYRERAHAACGTAEVSIRRIFEARAAKKRQFYQRACQRTRENLEKWSLEQHELALLAAERKKRRLYELTTQLQNAQQRKIDERRANVELELRLLRETEKLEEQRMLRENINLRKRIEYYQELSDMMRTDTAGKVSSNKQPEPQTKQEQPSKLSPQSDGSVESAQALQTPGSGGTDTDFESCCGEEAKDGDADADSVSLYAECLSEEFVHKFEENENELRAICEETTAKGEVSREAQEHDKTLKMLSEPGDGTPQEVSSETSFHTESGFATSDTAALSVQASKATFLKRSVSDVINSNEPPTGSVTHNISSTTVTIAPATHIETLTPSITIRPAALPLAPDATAERPLTEAQRNKLRVLAHEFGTYSSTADQPVQPDINLNTLPDSELTELQRNRRRMMQNDPFVEYNKSSLADRAHLKLNLDTERARNRRRVLESEFDILTGKTPSSTTFTVEQVATPMSTTSDTPLTESASESAAAVVKQSDLANGNLPPKTALKINVELANEPQESVEIEKSAGRLLGCHTADTQEASVTPDCALNTAGLQAKQGFDFVDADRVKKQQQAAAVEAPLQPDTMSVSSSAEEEEIAFPVQDYNDPYKRSRELLDSNFTCATRSPFIRLNMTTTPMVVAARKSRESLQQLKVNSMSVITLTEFLQKSVVLPMTTHLDLVNNEVMRLFLDELQILDHLRSLRHYFFLMDGEFGSIICDGIIGKLETGATPAKLLNYQMLHSILDTALSSSITGNDKNAENLSFTISDMPQKFDLTNPGVLNVLSLSYRIEWPLNLILNPETLEQYGNIFKYLIKVRRISWVLERAFQILKEAVKKHGKEILKSPQYRHVQFMRHKFYHFVHALQNHITANALQSSWKTFKDDLLQAKSIEDIYRKHTTYVKRILFLCMLNRHSVEFYNTIENIFKISLRFYNNLKSREFKQRSGDEYFTHSRYEKLSNDEQEFDKFIKFTIYLGNKIVRHGYQEEIGQLIALINFNQYYSASTIP